MNTRSLFQSKTIVFNLIVTLAGAVTAFIPDAADFVSNNAAAVLGSIAIANMILRRATKSAYTLFPVLIAFMALSLQSCSVRVNPDGSKDVLIDAAGVGQVTTILLEGK